MTKIRIIIDVDDEFADDNHETGMNEAGFSRLTNSIVAIGEIADGPTKVKDDDL